MNPRQAAMAKLRGYRSYGGSKERDAVYLGHREMKKVFTADLVEAVERLAIIGKGTSFPSLNEVLTVCRVAAVDRRAAERANAESEDTGSGPYLKDLPPAERRALLADWRKEYKALLRAKREKPVTGNLEGLTPLGELIEPPF